VNNSKAVLLCADAFCLLGSKLGDRLLCPACGALYALSDTLLLSR
jgi:hypothetical protein